LTDPSITYEKRVLRATALNLAAEAFLSIKKEGQEPIEDFVKVDTAASKQREGAARPPVPPSRPETTGYPKEKTPAATGAGAGGYGVPLPPRPPPNRPAPNANAEAEAKTEETLGAAYKACKSIRPLSSLRMQADGQMKVNVDHRIHQVNDPYIWMSRGMGIGEGRR